MKTEKKKKMENRKFVSDGLLVALEASTVDLVKKKVKDVNNAKKDPSNTSIVLLKAMKIS